MYSLRKSDEKSCKISQSTIPREGTHQHAFSVPANLRDVKQRWSRLLQDSEMMSKSIKFTACKLLPLLGVLACCYIFASHGVDEASHRRLCKNPQCDAFDKDDEKWCDRSACQLASEAEAKHSPKGKKLIDMACTPRRVSYPAVESPTATPTANEYGLAASDDAESIAARELTEARDLIKTAHDSITRHRTKRTKRKMRKKVKKDLDLSHRIISVLEANPQEWRERKDNDDTYEAFYKALLLHLSSTHDHDDATFKRKLLNFNRDAKIKFKKVVWQLAQTMLINTLDAAVFRKYSVELRDEVKGDPEVSKFVDGVLRVLDALLENTLNGVIQVTQDSIKKKIQDDPEMKGLFSTQDKLKQAVRLALDICDHTMK